MPAELDQPIVLLPATGGQNIAAHIRPAPTRQPQPPWQNQQQPDDDRHRYPNLVAAGLVLSAPHPHCPAPDNCVAPSVAFACAARIANGLPVNPQPEPQQPAGTPDLPATYKLHIQ